MPCQFVAFQNNTGMSRLFYLLVSLFTCFTLLSTTNKNKACSCLFPPAGIRNRVWQLATNATMLVMHAGAGGGAKDFGQRKIRPNLLPAELGGCATVCAAVLLRVFYSHTFGVLRNWSISVTGRVRSLLVPCWL